MTTQTLKQWSKDVMLLHQSTRHLMFATQNNGNTPNIDCAPYIMLNHCYYIVLPQKDAEIHNLHLAPQVAILLIEKDSNEYQKISLSWIVMARAMSLNESRYRIAFDTLKQYRNDILNNIQEICLCEFRPQQGILLSNNGNSHTLDGQDLYLIDA